ncbi:MAG: CDC48 family AAA ATPase, partial [Methanomicrobiales archaeon]|nr:CDC48 family AAA ATPase [Methanomicrobiales archaeon]
MAEVFLRVDTSYLNDQGGGKARLDPDTMFQLRISPGDIVYVEGKRKTVAKVWRMKKEDWHQGKIRIDNFTRTNAGASIGERVKVYPVDADVEAHQVVLAPPEDLASFHLPLNLKNAVNWLIDFPVVVNDVVPVHGGMPPFLQLLTFKAVIVEPENAVIITKNTEIEFSDKPLEGFEGIKRWSYEDIGGLKDELQRVRETIELPMRHPELFSRLGIDPPKGVLLHGPPGTGKTLIAKAVASESRAHFISIAGPEVISKYYGESEQKLREVFEAARQNAPSIIFIDELDSIAPRREDVTGEVERRVVAQLLTMMDGLEERGQVVVIGATNRVDAIDPALRRPGRFDREIEIGVPNENDRAEILGIHTRGMPLAEDVNLRMLAAQTHGFVGADLAALAREGAIRALRRYLPDIDLKKDVIPPEVLEAIQVKGSDFREALRDVGPSAMREVLLEVPHVSWDEVGGLEAAKQEVRELVEYPLTKRDQYEDLGIEPPKGILLYGPPGTGKTLIAKAVATESGANFIPVRGPQLLSKWVGESERAVREVFKKARQVAPSIIFFDEMDAIAPARGSASESHVVESVLNQILTEMDGLLELRGVMVMGATNRPDIVDPALLRAGRFDRLVYIGEPDLPGRAQILEVHTRLMPIQGSHMERILDLTAPLDEEGIEKMVAAVRRERHVTAQDLDGALRKLRRQMVQDLIERNHIALEGFSPDQFVEITLSLQDPVIEKIVVALRGEQGVSSQDILQAVAQGAAVPKERKAGDEENFRERILAVLRDTGVYFAEGTREHLIQSLLLLDEKDLETASTLLASTQTFLIEDLKRTLIRFPGSVGPDNEDRRKNIERLLRTYRLIP